MAEIVIIFCFNSSQFTQYCGLKSYFNNCALWKFYSFLKIAHNILIEGHKKSIFP